MIAELLLQRKIYNVGTHGDTDNPDNVIGELFLDGEFFCYTLEDRIRSQNEKVYGKTAISADKYNVVITMSGRFKRMMPLVYNQPDYSVDNKKGKRFTGVRIHGGNTEKNSEGCILVAFNTNGKKIWGTAEKKLTAALQDKKYTSIKLTIQEKGLSSKFELTKTIV